MAFVCLISTSPTSGDFSTRAEMPDNVPYRKSPGETEDSSDADFRFSTQCILNMLMEEDGDSMVCADDPLHKSALKKARRRGQMKQQTTAVTSEEKAENTKKSTADAKKEIAGKASAQMSGKKPSSGKVPKQSDKSNDQASNKGSTPKTNNIGSQKSEKRKRAQKKRCPCCKVS